MRAPARLDGESRGQNFAIDQIVLDRPFRLGTGSDPKGGLWLCVQADPAMVRVIVPLPIDTGIVTWHWDPALG